VDSCSEYRNFDISTDLAVKTITISGTSSTNILVDDEIMWFVNSESTASACADFRPGMFGFAHVKNKTVSADTILTLDHSLKEYVLNSGVGTTLNSPNSSNLSGSVCSIQIVRVPNYRNIHVSTVDTTINVLQFDPISLKVGGLFPFRVSNELKITGSGSLIINANSAGSDTQTVNSCNLNTRCMKMGTGTGASFRGGGIIFSAINRVVTDHAGAFLKFQANGAAGGSIGGDGGFINIKIG